MKVKIYKQKLINNGKLIIIKGLDKLQVEEGLNDWSNGKIYINRNKVIFIKMIFANCLFIMYIQFDYIIEVIILNLKI